MARFVASLPLLEMRREWLERIGRRNEEEFMERVEGRLREIWGKNKNVATD